MTYRTILVHLDSGPRCAVRVALAVRFAAAAAFGRQATSAALASHESRVMAVPTLMSH